MSAVRESNFPNSRITAALQAYDVDNPGTLLNIGGQIVSGKSCLLVQIAAQSGNPLQTNANLNEYQGMSSFNISNAFVPEGYDKITYSSTPLTDVYGFYHGVNHICDLVSTYTDASKSTLVDVKRV